jgi:hypothetical protein
MWWSTTVSPLTEIMGRGLGLPPAEKDLVHAFVRKGTNGTALEYKERREPRAKVDKIKAQPANMAAETDKLKTQQADMTAADEAVAKEAENVPVFYNLYLSPDADQAEYERVKQLVEEQLALMLPQHSANVISIGTSINSSSFFASTNVVTHVANHKSGNEQLTLSALWDYCRNNTSSKVVYLHSKALFHPKPQNDIVRKYLTRGALSDECLNLPDTCNVCSTRMSPLPHPHVSGNLWLARCSYISQLIDPLKFDEIMKGVYERKETSCLGVGCYAFEHWGRSHPTNMPCDYLHRAPPARDEEIFHEKENKNRFFNAMPLKWQHTFRLSGNTVDASSQAEIERFMFHQESREEFV